MNRLIYNIYINQSWDLNLDLFLDLNLDLDLDLDLVLDRPRTGPKTGLLESHILDILVLRTFTWHQMVRD